MTDLTLLGMLISALAAYRVWVLIAADTITEPLRSRTVDRAPGWVGDFVYCPWCLGFWLSLLFWAGWLWLPGSDVVTFVYGGLAVSAVVGFMGSRS